jgi:hypothetical protein
VPTLQFKGKTAVEQHHRRVPHHVLEIDRRLSLSKSPGLDGNLIVEGDNLLALKSLMPTHAGRVKCVYIDPPYNTGNEGWIYNDNLQQPQFKEWIGKEVGKEGEDACRHDKWCCMMYPRLQLLRDLLREDGVLFVSIDDTELANLILACDEIFGFDNRIAVFTWVRKKKGSHLDDKARRMTEYVVAYARNVDRCPSLWGEAAYADKLQPLVKRTNARKSIRLPPSIETTLEEGKYPAAVHGSGGTALEFTTSFEVRNHRTVGELEVEGRFVWTQAKVDEEIRLGTRIMLSKSFGLNALRWDQESKSKRPSTLLDERSGVGTNEDASAELAELFGAEQGRVFPFPKPVSLVGYLARTITHSDPDAIVVDSCAGSGTTAEAVLKLNAEDEGRRRFVIVQQAHDTAAQEQSGVNVCRDITRERVRRVLQRDSSRGTPRGAEVTYAKLGGRLLREYRNFSEPAPSYEDLAKYVWFTDTSQAFDAKGLNRKTGRIGEWRDTAYYLLYSPDGSGRTALDREFLAALEKERRPRRVVYCEKIWLHRDEIPRNVVPMLVPFQLKA